MWHESETSLKLMIVFFSWKRFESELLSNKNELCISAGNTGLIRTIKTFGRVACWSLDALRLCSPTSVPAASSQHFQGFSNQQCEASSSRPIPDRAVIRVPTVLLAARVCNFAFSPLSLAVPSIAK